MHFELHTAVWGDWHLDMFEQINAPTMLSKNNLPALSSRYQTRYRIFTTPDGRRRIKKMPIFHKLSEVLPVEIVIMAKDRKTAAIDHMKIWHRAYADAKKSGAVLMLVPPDHIWPDGVFLNTAIKMEDPNISGVAVPYTILVSESSVPEMCERFGESLGEGMTIKPSELIQLAMRHLHAHSAANLAGSRHSRAALEVLWPVPGKGLLYRCYVRELFAADTKRIQLTDHFYGTGVKDANEIYLATDSNEMFMGALHPLAQYASVHLRNRPLREIEVAACSMVGVNRAPYAWETARQPVYFRLNENDTERWTKQERESLLYFWRVIVNRELMYIREAAENNNALLAAQLISMILMATDFVHRWRPRGPFTVFLPDDLAIHQAGKEEFLDLAALKNEERLFKMTLSHALSGRVHLEETSLSEGQALTTLGGNKLEVAMMNGKPRINGRATVTKTIVIGDAGNVVHFIDAPLYENGFEAE